MAEISLSYSAVDWSDAAQAMLERAEKFDTVRGLDSIAAMRERGAPLYQVERAGKPVAYYVLEILHHPHGREAVIAAAAGRAPGVDLTTVILRTVELQAAGAVDHMTCQTQRPALVKKCVALGWSVDGIILRKTLKCQ